MLCAILHVSVVRTARFGVCDKEGERAVELQYCSALVWYCL